VAPRGKGVGGGYLLSCVSLAINALTRVLGMSHELYILLQIFMVVVCPFLPQDFGKTNQQ